MFALFAIPLNGTQKSFYLATRFSRIVKNLKLLFNAGQQLLKHGLVQPVTGSQLAILWLCEVETVNIFIRSSMKFVVKTHFKKTCRGETIDSAAMLGTMRRKRPQCCHIIQRTVIPVCRLMSLTQGTCIGTYTFYLDELNLLYNPSKSHTKWIRKKNPWNVK